MSTARNPLTTVAPGSRMIAWVNVQERFVISRQSGAVRAASPFSESAFRSSGTRERGYRSDTDRSIPRTRAARGFRTFPAGRSGRSPKSATGWYACRRLFERAGETGLVIKRPSGSVNNDSLNRSSDPPGSIRLHGACTRTTTSSTCPDCTLISGPSCSRFGGISLIASIRYCCTDSLLFSILSVYAFSIRWPVSLQGRSCPGSPPGSSEPSV